MLKSCRDGMSTGGTVLVFYTHHRPHLSCRDMQFFEKAKEQGWTCVEILTRHFDVRFPSLTIRRPLLIIGLVSLCFQKTQAILKCGQQFTAGRLRGQDLVCWSDGRDRSFESRFALQSIRRIPVNCTY